MKIINSKILNALLLLIIFVCLTECKKDEPKIPTTLTDIDGNSYNVIVIGTQAWMKENLRVTSYSNGDPIPNVTYGYNGPTWCYLTSPGYCWYNNDPTNYKATYGALYNWYTVNTGKLCPSGWHVPIDAEWTTLTDYLTNNGYGYQGSGDDIAKSLATISGWNTYYDVGTPGNDPASNNSSGFSALPVGPRTNTESEITNASFVTPGPEGWWWSATEIDATYAGSMVLSFNSNIVMRPRSPKQFGESVRCIKDK
jgi:uncharacterized protein (TIGR02145 family)